jgi:hypothetical protein
MINSNITPIESKQPAPAAKFTITCALDGFPVSIEVIGNADNLRAMIGRLKAIGAEPPALQILQKAEPQAEPTKKAAPLCPVHGAPMKASRKPGSWFCPRQAEDGSGYCPHKA